MDTQEKLTRDFFIRDTKKVAKELLGKYLVRRTMKGDMIGKIIEVEAYLGPKDKASHSYNYKKTKRTETMYEKPGTVYVYLIYGMYYCLNVITEPEGIPTAVLIRQLFPIEGIKQMVENRKRQIRKNFKNLVDGPGKLCMALNISKSEFNGTDCCSNESNLYFTHGENVVDENIVADKRIGIAYAEEDKERLLRFGLKQ
ncbi:MAG: DNA-3-methyladenine glycosylase [Promethearchaeota archaeon]